MPARDLSDIIAEDLKLLVVIDLSGGLADTLLTEIVWRFCNRIEKHGPYEDLYSLGIASDILQQDVCTVSWYYRLWHSWQPWIACPSNFPEQSLDKLAKNERIAINISNLSKLGPFHRNYCFCISNGNSRVPDTTRVCQITYSPVNGLLGSVLMSSSSLRERYIGASSYGGLYDSCLYTEIFSLLKRHVFVENVVILKCPELAGIEIINNVKNLNSFKEAELIYWFIPIDEVTRCFKWICSRAGKGYWNRRSGLTTLRLIMLQMSFEKGGVSPKYGLQSLGARHSRGTGAEKLSVPFDFYDSSSSEAFSFQGVREVSRVVSVVECVNDSDDAKKDINAKNKYSAFCATTWSIRNLQNYSLCREREKATVTGMEHYCYLLEIMCLYSPATRFAVPASSREISCRELLIEEGANIDVVDRAGQTPLMSAVICYNKEDSGLNSGVGFTYGCGPAEPCWNMWAEVMFFVLLDLPYSMPLACYCVGCGELVRTVPLGGAEWIMVSGNGAVGRWLFVAGRFVPGASYLLLVDASKSRIVGILLLRRQPPVLDTWAVPEVSVCLETVVARRADTSGVRSGAGRAHEGSWVGPAAAGRL
ncbi:26S proteasome non-ATPase regulatory subunit 10 [Tanacetum coccineum]|uniref:26S proteasome non-ATPase regulatory subunit 10 n=1 Tax=Tanacetum coccineum TaxID=301880 RepID=A0ABQ4Y7A6_9ASTR